MTETVPNQEINQQSQNLPLASNNKFKAPFIISLIVLVLVIIASIFLLSQNKKSEMDSKVSIITQIPTQSQSSISSINNSANSTENLKTYTNSSCGLSFQYPKDWDVAYEGIWDWKENEKSENFAINNSKKQYVFEGGGATPISFAIYKDNYNSDINNFLNNFLKVKIDPNLYRGFDDINGEKIYKIYGIVPPGFNNWRIIFKLGNVFVFYNSADDLKAAGEKEFDLVNKTFEQIISSVKFISISKNIPSGWKTYTSQKYGFKISYPSKINFMDSCGVGDIPGDEFCGTENDNFNPGFGIEPIFINQFQKTITILLMNSDKIEISTNNVISDIKKNLLLVGWKAINDNNLKIPNIVTLGFSKTDGTKYMEHWFLVKDQFLYDINFSYVTGEGLSNTQLQNQLTDLKSIFSTMQF